MKLFISAIIVGLLFSSCRKEKYLPDEKYSGILKNDGWEMTLGVLNPPDEWHKKSNVTLTVEHISFRKNTDTIKVSFPTLRGTNDTRTFYEIQSNSDSTKYSEVNYDINVGPSTFKSIKHPEEISFTIFYYMGGVGAQTITFSGEKVK